MLVLQRIVLITEIVKNVGYLSSRRAGKCGSRSHTRCTRGHLCWKANDPADMRFDSRFGPGSQLTCRHHAQSSQLGPNGISLQIWGTNGGVGFDRPVTFGGGISSKTSERANETQGMPMQGLST